MSVAYLVNQYPKVSHTFVRREIIAREALGETIHRFSLRPCPDVLVDERDTAELERTEVLISGVPALAMASLRALLRSPAAWLRAFKLTLLFGRRSPRGMARVLGQFLVAARLFERCRALGIEQIHCHFGTNSATVAALCRELGGPPYGVTIHGPEEFENAWSLGIAEKVERSGYVAAISHYCRSQIMRHTDVSQWSKITIVRCGVDVDSLGEPLEMAKRQNQLVCVGRLSPEKGHWLMLDAIERLRGEGHRVHLALVGDGPLADSLAERIRAAQLGDSVSLLGWKSQEEIQELLRAAHGFVMASFAEGLPVTLMEASAMGIPSVAPRITGIPELVTPETGFLFDAGSLDSLCDALRALLSRNPDELALMGDLARTRVRELHSIEDNARILRDASAALGRASTT